MKIRNATENDYHDVIALYNDFVGSDRYSSHTNDSYKKVLNNPSNVVFVAEDNGEIIGFASFSIRDVIRYPKPIVELDELFVSPEYRKLGVGKELMKQVETKAKEVDCYRIFIESHYDHKVAHQFYESIGYTNYGFHFIKNL